MKNINLILSLFSITILLSACSPEEPSHSSPKVNSKSNSSTQPSASPNPSGTASPTPGPSGTPVAGSPTPTPAPTATPGPIVAGGGEKVAGTGSLSVPTANGIIARLVNGLQKSVSPTAGNFARSLAQVRSNLPKVTDPLKATGYDQIQLLVYGACSDLTTGTTPIMQSKYGVNPANSIAASQAALIAAGMLMLDQYTAGIASQGPTASQVQTALTTLVTTVGATAGNTSRIAFMSVCIAANTAGVTMMGY